MAFKFEIKGFDKIKKSLDQMIQDLEPEGFAEWATKIEKTAKEICKDPDCKRIKFKPKKGKTSISMSFADEEALECLKKAIAQHKSSMSIGLRAFYEQALPQELKKIEEQLKKSKSKN